MSDATNEQLDVNILLEELQGTINDLSMQLAMQRTLNRQKDKIIASLRSTLEANVVTVEEQPSEADPGQD